MNEKINAALVRLTRRAEASDPSVLVSTFVDTGMLQTLLTSPDHQVIYGRRGTGKTHALLYLAETKREAGDITIYVDMRTIGSSVGLFSDETIPITERATRLLRDTLAAVHDRLYAIAIEQADSLNLGEIGKYLDTFIDCATETQVIGSAVEEQSATTGSAQEAQSSLNAGVSAKGLHASIGVLDEAAVSNSNQHKVRLSGSVRHRVRFGAIGKSLENIAKSITPRRIWLLLDEWSAVPIELQPYLADLIRRSILPVRGVSAKIAAIEQRSEFQLPGERGDYTGIEVGADVTADLNLDDFMVFDNDSRRALAFFRTLIFNHFKAVQAETGPALSIASETDFVRFAFTQRTALEEIVRAPGGAFRETQLTCSASAHRRRPQAR